MIQFENLSIRGFCSTESLDLNLNQKGITLVKGANGEGKSTWLSAITWALYGKSLKGVSDVNTWPKYQNKSYKGTMVSLYWRSKGDMYRVIRCLNYKGEVEGAKGNNRLILLKNAEIIDFKKKADIQAQITEALGMSYQLFMSSIMFGQGVNRLIQESSTDKKQIFEEIFDLSYISKAQIIAKESYQRALAEYKTCEYDHQKIISFLEATKRSLEISNTKVRDFISSHKPAIKSAKEKIKKLRSELDDLGTLPKIDKSKINALNDKLAECKSDISVLEDKTEDISLEEVIDNVLELLTRKEFRLAQKKLEGIKKNYVALEFAQKRKSDLLEKINKASHEIHQLTLLQNKISRKKSDIQSAIKHLEDLKAIKAPTVDHELNSIINIHRKKADACKQRLDILSEQVDIYKWVYTDPLGPNGIKAFIFDSSIQDLNQILSNYSDVLGIHINFLIDTSLNRKDFEAVIQMDGHIVLFEELSGGQKQLVHLAMALAMNQLVTSHHQVNIAFMDEIFESLSKDNIDIVVALLKKMYKDRNLFMITHHDSLPVGNARVITVSKIKGLSQYIF